MYVMVNIILPPLSPPSAEETSLSAFYSKFIVVVFVVATAVTNNAELCTS